MNISVVIPVLDEAGYIACCIERAWRAGADEVIVVDGGSRDGTPWIARGCRCAVVESSRGRGVQQNVGARHASGEVVAFLHADSWLGADALRQVEPALNSDRVVGGAFRQRIEARGLGYRLIERGNRVRARWLNLPYGDQGIFVRREVLDRVGGFPEVPLMEDVRLVRKLRRHGRLAILPGPIFTSARRWQQHGLVRQTVRNWTLLAAERLGASPEKLARYY